MKNILFCTALTVSTMVFSPALYATDPAAGIKTANNFFDANWKLLNTDTHPYRPPLDHTALASKYFDANGSLFNISMKAVNEEIDKLLVVNND